MNTGRRVVAILLAALVGLPLAVLTLTLIPVSTWVLDRNFYRTLASDTRVYELWQAEKLPDYFVLQGNASVDGLPAAALGNALRQSVDPRYLRDQAVGVIDQSFDILEGKANSPEVLVDLAPIKISLRGPAALNFATALATSLPACAAGEQAIARGATIPGCRVPGDSTDQTAALIAAGLPAYLTRLPDRVNIGSADTAASYRFLQFGWMVASRLGLGLAIVVLALIAIAVALLAAVLGADTAGGRLQWLGWMLLVPAVLVFLMGPVMYVEPWRNWVRYSWFGVAGGPYAELYHLALRTSVGAALRTIAAGFMITGAVAGLAGVIAIAMGSMTSRQGSGPRTVRAERTAAEQR